MNEADGNRAGGVGGGGAGDSDDGAGEERVRCFVAAFVTPESAERLAELARSALDRRLLHRRTARPVPPASYHVTLKFLGDVTSVERSRALNAVSALGGTAAAGQVTALTGFPRPHGARLVAAELAHHPLLEAWWGALQESLGVEDRPFRPHVTLIRLRRVRSLTPVVLPEPVALELQTPALYASDRTRDGARYRRVSNR